MDRQSGASNAPSIGIDVEALLRTAAHGKRIVAAAGTHHRIFGRLEVDETAARADDGWLPASIVMCPHILGPHDHMEESSANAAIDTALADGTTSRVLTKVRLSMNDNFDTFVVLAVPSFGGTQHGLSGWTCYSPAEVRWHLHRDTHVTLHLMTVADVIQDIRANAKVLFSRLNSPESREEALALSCDFAGRVIHLIGEAVKTFGKWGNTLEARYNTYHYSREGEAFGLDGYEVYLSYYSRHNPEADKVIWVPKSLAPWTPNLGSASSEALMIYAAEQIVAELANGMILEDIVSHLDYLVPPESLRKTKPFDAVFPFVPEYYAGCAQELRNVLAKTTSDQEYEQAVCAAKQFVTMMNSKLIRLADIAGSDGRLGQNYRVWRVGARPGKDEGSVRRFYCTSVCKYTVWMPEIFSGETSPIAPLMPEEFELCDEVCTRGAMDILHDLSDVKLLRGIKSELERSKLPSHR